MRGRVAARLRVAPGSAITSYNSGLGARTKRNRSLRHEASMLQPNACRGYSVSAYAGRSSVVPAVSGSSRTAPVPAAVVPVAVVPVGSGFSRTRGISDSPCIADGRGRPAASSSVGARSARRTRVVTRRAVRLKPDPTPGSRITRGTCSVSSYRNTPCVASPWPPSASP